MNSGCYRVIFNKARGMLMVVSEAARSQGKTGNPANGGSKISQVAGASQTAAQTNSTYQGGQLVALRSHVLLALGLATIVASSVSISHSAYADATSIVADRNAAANQQATILKSSNGTTQVNIQAPSAAGVSRNVFSQFDVGADGAILNNSRTNAQTQLAGWVEGNPYLARGEARVILNEVNSSDPSRLSGYTEIAGGRAELVIANPAGISCAGCGFINASRTTLTTGNALMDQGKLTGFDVSGGKVRIDGDGLDTSGSDYTQIIAKTSEINAAVYAKNLDVITGSNKVSYEADAQDTVITSANSNASNTTTGVALDVSALGAMYAGKIRLIGTDKGMGVTNAGSIIASSGGLQLDNDGNLINSGSLIANQGKVDIATKGFSVDNSGTIASSRDTATLNSSTLNNSGVISSRGTLSLQQTGTIDNSGEIATGSFDVKANALNNSGKLLQTGSGQLAIDTSALVNQQGGIIGQDLYADASIPPTVIPTKKPPTTATNGRSVGVDNNDTTQPSEPNPVPLPVISRDGSISTSNVTNTGSIYSNGKINIATDTVVNQGKSSLAVSRLDIANNGSLTNNGSRLQLENIDWQLANFDNSNSQITAANTIAITSVDQINNTKGTIEAVGNIKLNAQSMLDNTSGLIRSNGTITTQSSAFDNTEGELSSQGDITLDSRGNLTNNKGRIQSDKNLTINAKSFSNTDGTIIGVQRADISVTDDITINSSNNNIQGKTLALTSQGNFTNSSKLVAQDALTIKANSIDNTIGGELISNGTTELSAKTDINNRGLINGSNTHLDAGSTVNNYSGGRIYGDQVAIAANMLNNTPDAITNTDNSNPAPVIAARNRLDIGVTTLNNNPNQARAGKFNADFNDQARLLSNGELHIGGSLDANHQTIGRATTVTNKGASIESVGDMTISTDLLNNVNADFRKEAFPVGEVENKEQFAAGGDDARAYDPDIDGRKYDAAEVELRDDKKLDNEDLYVIATNQPLGASGGENFYIFNFNQRITEDRTVVSDPSRIISGGVITLQGNQLNNDKSQLGLGEGFVVTGDSVTNVGESDLQGFKIKYIEDGNVIYRHVESSGLTGSKHKIVKDNLGAYVQAPEKLESYQLPILEQDLDKVVIAHDITDNDNQQIIQTPTDEIRSSDSAPTLPNSSLYGVNPDSDADYLIETDPAFANYKNWLSSSYMLDRLKLDPNITQKRLGDGYYEQQYIRDQIMMLTGRYYLGDYRNQDTQYQGLMDAGVTTAQTLNLRPGIALTDAQVATLTTDIVWLVQQNITLADGSIQKVLVPKVYTRQAVGQIDGTGNLIAANNIDMQLTGDLSNQGSIVGHKKVKINVSNLTNQNGGLIAGDYVQIGTLNDLNNLGGTLQADNAMQLNVGGDLNNKSLTYSTESVKGASNATRTDIAQIASIYVGDGLKGQVDANSNALTTFVANVGGNTTFAAGRLDNLGGSSVINTTGDVNLNAVNVGYQSNSIGDANNYYKQGESLDIGSQITGSDDIIIKAGNNITGTATQINSDTGTIGVIAGNDITFVEGRYSQNLSTAVKTVDKGVFSTTKTQDRFDSQSDNSVTSNIEGNQIAIQAGNNISLTGTNAISDKGTSLTAGSNIDILAAQNTSSESTFSQTKKSGLFGADGADGGMGFTIGKQQNDDSNASTTLTHTASNVGAIDGNVIISAGGKYQQTGSNIIAGMGADSDKDISPTDRGNTVIRAKTINIDSVKDVYTNQSETKFKQSGLTVSVSNSLVDSAKSIDSLIDAGGNTDNVRMKGMAGVAGALKVKALAKEANKAAQGLLTGGVNAQSLKGLGNTRIQATVGTQKSQSNSSSYTEKNQASNITTNNLALIATGAGTDSDINVNGSNLNVTNDALFKADNDFNLNGVAQNSKTRSTKSSSSMAIGGYMDSSGSGGITASASKGKGYANSDSVTYANTQVNVGGTTTFDIANDVNGKGVVFNTDKVQGIIRGNVNMESPQDTYTYDSNQKSAGFNLDVDIMGNGKGSSFSANGAKTNITADSKMVAQQTGFFANEADLVVEGKGTFTGAVFLTSEEAQAKGKSNIVFKQGVTSTDIINTTSYQGDAISVGLSVGKIKDKPQATMNGLGYGSDGDSNSSITKGGVSGYNDEQGIFTMDNREALAGKLESVFDANRVTEELGAQTQITKEFGKEAPKAVGDFANNRIKAIIADTTLSNAEKNAAIAKWDEGGIYRVAAHTALGALGTGSVEGALTTGGVAAAAPTLNDVQAKVVKALIDKGMSADIAEGTASGVISLTLLGVGSAAGLDTSSTVIATNVDANNRQLHPSEIQFILDKDRVKRFADKYGLTEEEAKQLLSLNAAAMYDYNWMMAVDEIGAANPAVRVFLKQEAKNAGYSQLFNSEYITKEELSNPFINLKTTFDAYSEGDKHVEDYINNVAIPVDDYLAQQLYKQGQKAGYASAGEGANIATDLGTIFEGLKQAPSYIYESATNNEVGPIDSAKMKMYYDRLLRLQGNYYDAGFTSEKEFAEAQRLYWAGEMLGAAGGAATGQVVRLTGKVGDGIVKLHTPSNAINVPNNNQTGVVGNLSNIDKTGDYVLPTGRQSLDPTITSFSQKTVSYQKPGKDYNYDTILADMKTNNAWIGDPVDVVNMPDGAPTSVDNTRILAAREAGVKVEANVHNYSDPIPLERAENLIFEGKVPSTWGEAIELRVKKQATQRGVSKEWPDTFPNGSIYDPEVMK
ncbi:filamentous hemagglutinin N-terminal domain-containing protein [Psychrobacter sp. ANT_H56B]|uniref:two-partner secretion domain-containing protein n=1 Tax=Psychrobacter sp. ANT_H56B TaxID=2597353 RepID=UPI0011F27CC1|nr:hemagglutinin repeat-containing protein [Psychrobacter sp. ANT_H56B]KAA0925445.1 filamentous hemagglutinin N-terminal domain-containing protein [Psychrobacter sp. ANT_H56B]